MRHAWKAIHLCLTVLILCSLGLASASASTSSANASDFNAGDYDLTFGGSNTGRVSTNINDSAWGDEIRISPTSGSIVIAGPVHGQWNDDFGAAQYLPDGTPDPNFGGGTGIAIVDFGGPPDPEDWRSPIPRSDLVNAMVIQPDGMIVLGGTSNNGYTHDFALARLTTTGVLDEGFGEHGRVRHGFPGVHWDGNYAMDDILLALGIQSDGKIIAVGRVWDGEHTVIGLSRYLPNGALDSSFGASGMITMPYNEKGGYPEELVVRPDDSFLVAGTISGPSFPEYNNFAAWAFCPNGLPANGVNCAWNFGAGGLAQVNFNNGSDDGMDDAYDVAMQRDGKFVLAGASNINGDSDYALARLTSSGALDPTFGSGGRARFHFNTNFERAYAVAVEPDGKIVMAGNYMDSNSPYKLARLCANGSMDNGANCGPSPLSYFGEENTSIGTGMVGSWPSGIAVQSDGKIIVAGTVDTGTKRMFAMARYMAGARSTVLVDTYSLVNIPRTNVKVQRASGDPCSITVEKNGVFPGGSPDPGELPAIWQVDVSGDSCAMTFTLTVCYTDQELQMGGITSEANLKLFNSSGGQVWDEMGGVVSSANNCISLANVTAQIPPFWTVMEGQPVVYRHLYLAGVWQ